LLGGLHFFFLHQDLKKIQYDDDHILQSSTKVRTCIMLNISKSTARSPLTTSSTTIPEYHPIVGEPRSK
jgi:hypothetical protein